MFIIGDARLSMLPQMPQSLSMFRIPMVKTFQTVSIREAHIIIASSNPNIWTLGFPCFSEQVAHP